MSATAPCIPGCCSTTQTVNVPGSEGDDGLDGSDGQNAWTLTTSLFTVPAVGDTVTIPVLSSLWMAIGQVLVVNGTYFKVISKASATTFLGQNLGYSGSVAPAGTIAAGSTISPAGSLAAVQPCFAANLNGVDQTAVVTATITPLAFSNEVFDSHNNYDVTTYRFTPTVAGVYRLTVSVEVKAMADTKIVTAYLYKNTNIAAIQKIQMAGTTSGQAAVNFLSEANGSTDYFTASVAQDSGGNKDVDGANTKSFFQGNWVGVAS